MSFSAVPTELDCVRVVPQIFARIPALLAAHPPVHQGLRAPCPTQVTDLRSMREQHIPCRQPQHRLLRSTGNEPSRFGQSQPPVLRVAPRITANIAVVSLCKRHTKNLSIPRASPYATSNLGQASRSIAGGPSPEVGIRLHSEARAA
jgi:hypothetical protein